MTTNIHALTTEQGCTDLHGQRHYKVYVAKGILWQGMASSFSEAAERACGAACCPMSAVRSVQMESPHKSNSTD